MAAPPISTAKPDQSRLAKLRSSIAEMRQLQSELLGRRELSRGLGVTYDGLRNIYDALGYAQDISVQQFRDRYNRGGIAKRIIEALPKATWAGETAVIEDPDVKVDTRFEQELDALFGRLKMWDRLRAVDILSGIGRYGVLVIGAPGAMSEPLKKASAKTILWVATLAEDRAKIDTLVKNVADPRYGMPEFYSLNLGSPGTSDFVTRREGGSRWEKTHWTRVVHVAEEALEDDIYGAPRLEIVWNDLDNLDKIVGGGSEAAWRRMDPGIHFDIDPEMEFGEEELNDLQSKIDDYIHNLRRTIQTRGVEMETLSSSVSAFGTNADTVLKIISGTTGIPLRILLGSERGELASTQDRDNWADRVGERRRSYGTSLVLAVVNYLVALGALPRPQRTPTVQWAEAEEMNEQQKGALSSVLASANSSQVASGDTPIMTSAEIRDRVWGMEELEADQLPDGASDDAADDVPADDTDGLPIAASRRLAAKRSREVVAIAGAAARNRKKVAATVLALWVSAASLSAADLERALERRNVLGAERLVIQSLEQAEKTERSGIESALRATLIAGGRAVAGIADQRGRYLAARIRFDIKSPRAIRWAEDNAGRMIRDIDAGTREGIRRMIASGLRGDVSPGKLAQQIRERIGLREDQVERLERMGEDPSVTDAEIRREADRMIRDRASRIADDETREAANAGQQEAWLQARDSGLLAEDAMRVWITAGDDRVRDEHEWMEGQVRLLDQPFNKEDGTPIEPGEEPGCRCAQGIASEEDVRAYEEEA